jgi:uncharacterized membrane-anchored protein YhcB (DUF1043 family)
MIVIGLILGAFGSRLFEQRYRSREEAQRQLAAEPGTHAG